MYHLEETHSNSYVGSEGIEADAFGSINVVSVHVTAAMMTDLGNRSQNLQL